MYLVITVCLNQPNTRKWKAIQNIRSAQSSCDNTPEKSRKVLLADCGSLAKAFGFFVTVIVVLWQQMLLFVTMKSVTKVCIRNKSAFAAYQVQKVLENVQPLKHWTRLRKHWYVGRRSNQTFTCLIADKVYWHRKITKNEHTWKKRNFYQASSLRGLFHRHYCFKDF